jgi:hypothetical protein
MSLPDEIVFLFDCDNTRLDNDRVQGRSLRTHLASEFGLSALLPEDQATLWASLVSP